MDSLSTHTLAALQAVMTEQGKGEGSGSSPQTLAEIRSIFTQGKDSSGSDDDEEDQNEDVDGSDDDEVAEKRRQEAIAYGRYVEMLI